MIGPPPADRRIGSTRLGAAALVAVWLATFNLTSLTQDLTPVPASIWALIAILGAVGYGLRRLRFGPGAVFAGQTLMLAGFVTFSFLGEVEVHSQPWPAGVVQLWTSGIEHMWTQSAPMSPNSGVRLIFVVAVGIVLLLTDLLAAGLRRPALAIFPPMALSLSPAVAVDRGTDPVSFVWLAGGVVAILLADSLDAAARWKANSTAQIARGTTAAPELWRAAGLVAVPAITAAIVLGVALPALSLPGSGLGDGLGGRGTVQLGDPTLDLRRNLNQPADRVVIEYQTDQPGGVYLRMASLAVFDSAGWRPASTRLSTGQTLPAIPGVSTEPAQRRRTAIRVLNFESRFLPLPYAPRQVEVDGSWAYDPASLVMVASGGRNPDTAIRNSNYMVESVDIAPTPGELADAVPGTPVDASLTAVVPPDLPNSLRSLSEQITANADTAAGKAAAIQAFLRSDRFTYSTEPLPGNGYQAMENFLLQDRRGYCEQFATSMAMMARIVGIPTRVGVGFLPGTRDGDTWRVGIRNMHAWPELYFAGLGWVRYEPTPAAVTGSPPVWTIPRADNDTPTTAPTTEPSLAQPSAPTTPDNTPTEAPVDENIGSESPASRELLLTAGGLLALLILALPGTVRLRRRRERLTSVLPPAEQVEAAWAEIRDTVIDHGGSWPNGSPQMIGSELTRRLEGAPPVAQLATMVDRSRYARTFAHNDAAHQPPQLASAIRRAIADQTTWRRRLLATVLPLSVTRRSSTRKASVR